MTAVLCRTDDGLTLEGEWRDPIGTARGAVVLCHPHPQYGGTMRSIVISALFDGLPSRGYGCLRFNFRGVEGSEGEHAGGIEEQRDVVAAIDTATAQSDAPLIVVGWSFGADVALTVRDTRLRAWVGIAPPLRFRAAADYEATGTDRRAKLLLLAAHDEYRAPAEIEAEVASWENTRTETIAGASHFFVGRTDRVVVVTADFLDAETT
jgi:alpha/beta superfamily hydrolase